MNRIRLALTVIIIVATAPAQAYTVYGFGNSSCGEWTSDHLRGGMAETANHFWLSGFLTGINYGGTLGEKIRDGTDAAGANAWMDNYCAAHPLDDVMTAADNLLVELIKRRTR